jgi:transposase
MKILAIDLGKYNSVACLFDTANNQSEFETIATQLTALEQVSAVHVPVAERRQYRLGVKYRKPLVNRINRIQNHIRTLFDHQGMSIPSGHKAWTVAGIETFEVIVAALDNPHRFKNARQVSAYAGLVPDQRQSGQTNRLGRITCRGSRILRSALVEVAWVMLRYNPG